MRIFSQLSTYAALAASICFFTASTSFADEAQSQAAEVKAPPVTASSLQLGRGVNVLGYDSIWNNFDSARFKEGYFEQIKQAGFDHIRLNIHPFRHMQGAEKNYQMKDSWYKTLDWIVDHALQNDLKVILDLHEFNAVSQDPAGTKAQFISFWQQMSDKFSTYSNRVVFEILNEPHDKLTAELWNTYLQEALTIIRQKNPERPVIIGPIGWNSIDKLDTLELPAADTNLIVTIHYYQPFRFTHQGATWVGPELAKTSGITWGTDEEKATVQKDFNTAQQWSTAHHRPIYLGEFGAYDKGEMKYRVCYTDYVCRTAESMHWSWAYWQFDSDFIVYDVKKDAWVEPILKALIPNTPIQK